MERTPRGWVTLLLLLPFCATATEPVPRLVLQITVDQLRGDLPFRYEARYPKGGFRYLLDEGVWYTNAHHAHACTETIVGHTTLATGADPAVHGMVSNVWFDRQLDRLVYNVEDARYPILTPGAGVDVETEFDPTQAIAGSDGRSPAAIRTTTFGDGLSLSSAGRAKVFGVSVKDRGAISMAGHSGKAFWFSKRSSEFVTSNYYYDEYPDWVKQWNNRRLPDRYAGQAWTLLEPRAGYLFGDSDDQPWETELPGFGRTFDHPFGAAEDRFFTTLLTVSPAGDELTQEFAEALIVGEGLGEDEVTDYLSISYSSVDYVGHIFGPSSLESEDNMLRLDRTLARLFAYIDEHVGLKNTLIVLSADHGGPDAVGYARQFGIDAGGVDVAALTSAELQAKVSAQFGVDVPLIETFFQPYLYLDREAIRSNGLDQADVERFVARQLTDIDGILVGVSSSDLTAGRLPQSPVIERIRRNHNPSRSGDVYVVYRPHWFINDFDGLAVSSVHGSPWRYDSHVPIVFAGFGMQPARPSRAVHTVDVASTLASVVGSSLPASAVGEPLTEVAPRRR